MAAPIDDPAKTIDLANVVPGNDPLTRVHGAGFGPGFPLGVFGVPVAGGSDIDGDGFADFAVAHMIASPLGRPIAGEVNLVFGNGTLGEVFDLGAGAQARVLRIVGAGNLGVAEMTGSEIWMGDVTGDGIGDLILCRQNFSFGADGPDGFVARRLGAGAVTVIVGGPEVRALANSLQVLDLKNPPPRIHIFNLFGGNAFDRLGIWARVGDVDGDGTMDLLAAADQENEGADTHSGAVYIVRGGSHLAQSATVRLDDFGTSILAGSIARIVPPAGSSEFHFGSTCQLGDLDANGRAEVLVAAALNRAGAVIGPLGVFTAHGSGGPVGGQAFVVWDDNFPTAPWPAGYEVNLGAAPGSVTSISGGVQNGSFGEELLGGLDYDQSGKADLFIGDLVGDGTQAGNRPSSGIGYIFHDAVAIKGLSFNVDNPPGSLRVTKFLGPVSGAIAADTVAHGDFDGDSVPDLMIGSPHADPLGRVDAGIMHVVFGKATWPALIDTAPGAFPPATQVSITEILGANGAGPGDTGDTLCYSAAAGDIDGDGIPDIIANEMVGNGTSPGSIDAGNLIVLSGAFTKP